VCMSVCEWAGVCVCVCVCVCACDVLACVVVGAHLQYFEPRNGPSQVNGSAPSVPHGGLCPLDGSPWSNPHRHDRSDTAVSAYVL
jgi:hypothetical protein